MTGVTDEGRLPEPPIYVIEMREIEDRAEVAIVRIPRDPAATDGSKDVWTHRFANLEAARIVMQVMMSRPGRWSGWASMADILGMDFLTGLIEAEVVQATSGAASTVGESRMAFRRRERAVPRAEYIEVTLALSETPQIVARHEGRRFMVMTRDTALEAWRVWDWVRWQTNSLPAWFDMAQRQGAKALERFIIDAMLTAEGKMKAAGLAADGGRPLRNWRPAGAAPPAGPDQSHPGSDGKGD